MNESKIVTFEAALEDNDGVLSIVGDKCNLNNHYDLGEDSYTISDHIAWACSDQIGAYVRAKKFDSTIAYPNYLYGKNVKVYKFYDYPNYEGDGYVLVCLWEEEVGVAK